MDAIFSYLDNMFAHLPKTEEVKRAKSELGQMMEDKYSCAPKVVLITKRSGRSSANSVILANSLQNWAFQINISKPQATIISLPFRMPKLNPSSKKPKSLPD